MSFYWNIINKSHGLNIFGRFFIVIGIMFVWVLPFLFIDPFNTIIENIYFITMMTPFLYILSILIIVALVYIVVSIIKLSYWLFKGKNTSWDVEDAFRSFRYIVAPFVFVFNFMFSESKEKDILKHNIYMFLNPHSNAKDKLLKNE